MDHSWAATSPDADLRSAGQAPPLPTGPRDPGDTWVEGERGRFWGRFGAAGVLAYDPHRGALLQHRAVWSHNGGTWGLPGGALHEGEDAVTGALREAYEEAAVPAESGTVLFTSVLDVGYWSYTTVVLLVLEPFDPVISDPESIELQWVQLADVDSKELHPGFAASWPGLRQRVLDLTGSAAGRRVAPRADGCAQ